MPSDPIHCHNRACAVVRPHQHHEGYLSDSEVTPMPWEPKGRPPFGQYRVELVITGDDQGPDVLAWLIERQMAALGFITNVQAITSGPYRPK